MKIIRFALLTVAALVGQGVAMNMATAQTTTQTSSYTIPAPLQYGSGTTSGLYTEQALLNNTDTLHGFGLIGLGYVPFSTATGTLQSVTVNVSGSAYGTVIVSSSNPTPYSTSSGSFNYYEDASLLLSAVGQFGTGYSTTLGSPVMASGSASYSGVGNQEFNPGEPLDGVVGLAAIPVNESFTITDPTALAALGSQQDIQLSLQTLFGLTSYQSNSPTAGGDTIAIPCDAGFDHIQSSCAFGGSYTAAITYTYGPAAQSGGGSPTSPVPLPASAWLMLSGLGALACLARQKRTAA